MREYHDCKVRRMGFRGLAYGSPAVNLMFRLETCEKLAKETGFLSIDPHNDVDIMAGQVR